MELPISQPAFGCSHFPSRSPRHETPSAWLRGQQGCLALAGDEGVSLADATEQRCTRGGERVGGDGDPQADALKDVPSHSKAPHFNDLICLFALILIWQLMKMQFGNIL